ncbi:hypothetical protein [Shewanella phage vB_SbaS_Y11]|nr:hypothetical protein [Shewanella phage vB_SbaS_Y11]
MHQPRPYGLHAIGLPLTERDEAFINSITKRITSLKELSKVDSIKMVYDLPDGGYVIVQDMGGNFRVISHKPIHGKDPIFDGVETDYIPMLFSGTITKAVAHENEPVGLRLTEAARFRLVNYSHLAVKPDKDIELQRFRIDYDDKFSEFKPKFPSAILRTQYVQQSPLWYSGAMSEVVQIVGGYGRQDFANLPDEKVEPLERARVKLPQEWLDRINKDIKGLRLPAYTGLPPADGSFQFDYKFNNTNAVGFDDKNKPWLLRISPSGVYAMPLPIVPATRTDAFRRYMYLMGDDEILAILDRFGGMPSGEAFPEYRNFEAWRRAGAIIKVCEVSDFYSHIAYSSACGWSLNSKGTEGYNTCYDYYDDEGLGYGLTYKLKLNLVSTDEYYGAKQVVLADEGPIANKVRLYLNQFIPTLGSTSDDRAILYKLRRATSVDIYQRALGRMGDDKQERDYWHNLEMEPIAKHTGNVSEVYRGYLYHGAKFQFQPQIKFPEPLVGACISHDFLPMLSGRYADKYPNSDTIMFAYYVGDSLKTVKYFVNWDNYQQETQGNFEQYMRAGSWWQEETSGRSGVQGYFYSSDIDDREIVSPNTTYTTIVGEDKGFDTKPAFSFDYVFSMVGTLFRNRYYTHKTNVVSKRDRTIDVAVCIPYLCRNAILQAKRESIPEVRKSESYQLLSVRDPTSYRYWTYHFVYAWQGMDIKNPKGNPYPSNGNPVWVETMSYSPNEANSFADNGDWVGGLPADYTWLIHPDSNVWQAQGGGGAPTVDSYSRSEPATSESSGMVKLSMAGNPDVVNNKMPDSMYFLGSPTEFGNYFYRDACQVMFGETTYRNVSEPSASSPRAKWGYTRLVGNQSAHHFIGVINE